MHLYRSHNCNELRKEDDGKAVKLSGWVHRIRDHGGVLFIDLRDHFGLTQVLADPDSPVFKDVESNKLKLLFEFRFSPVLASLTKLEFK